MFLSDFTINNLEIGNPVLKTVGNTTTALIIDPGNTRVKKWIKENIEDEFQYKDWHLRVQFIKDTKKTGSKYTRVVFEKEITPNYNPGNNTITLNKDEDLDASFTKVTIRHEFGHALGFPDCYVEFLDEREDIVIYYPIDKTNIMCASQGHFTEKSYQEFKRAYKLGK
jgi:hypothetical protein